MFAEQGPSLRELTVQALSSVEHGYDLLAPKFDHTPFRTRAAVLDGTVDIVSGLGPFTDGLDVCCGTGAGTEALTRLCTGSVTGVDFSDGMLARAGAAVPDARRVRADARALPFREGFDLAVSFGALGHFLPAERPAIFEGVFRALRPGGLLAFPIESTPPVWSGWNWLTLGFDTTMRVRNAVWRPPFVMYYRVHPLRAVLADLEGVGFTASAVALRAAGEYRDGTPICLLVLARKP